VNPMPGHQLKVGHHTDRSDPAMLARHTAASAAVGWAGRLPLAARARRLPIIDDDNAAHASLPCAGCSSWPRCRKTAGEVEAAPMPATRAPGTREREMLAVQTARGRARQPGRAGRSAKPLVSDRHACVPDMPVALCDWPRGPPRGRQRDPDCRLGRPRGEGRRKIEQPGRARCSRTLGEVSSCSSAAGSSDS